MADAKRVPAVERYTKETIKEKGVELRLTMAETRAVFGALWRVGGSPTQSPRGRTDARPQ